MILFCSEEFEKFIQYSAIQFRDLDVSLNFRVLDNL